jgi:hypothetical protein
MERNTKLMDFINTVTELMENPLWTTLGFTNN